MSTEHPPITRASLGKRIWNFPLTRIFMGILILAGTIIIGQLILVGIGKLIFTTEKIPYAWKTYSFAVMTFLIILSYLFYVRKIEKRESAELARSKAWLEAGIGCAIGFGLMAAITFILWILGYYQVEAMNNWVVLLLPFFGALFTGFFEEFLFRGIIFRIINNSLGSWLALLLSALIFGFAHASNPNATLYSSGAIALEAGILLSAGYLFTNRLWMVIGLHFAWNFTLGGIFGIVVSGVKVDGLLQAKLEGPVLLTGGAFGAETSIITVVICLLTGIYFIWKAQQRGHFTRPYWRHEKISTNFTI
jgi:membrane protease YdiL (CAAX protease family)